MNEDGKEERELELLKWTIWIGLKGKKIKNKNEYTRRRNEENNGKQQIKKEVKIWTSK